MSANRLIAGGNLLTRVARELESFQVDRVACESMANEIKFLLQDVGNDHHVAELLDTARSLLWRRLNDPPDLSDEMFDGWSSRTRVLMDEILEELDEA